MKKKKNNALKLFRISAPGVMCLMLEIEAIEIYVFFEEEQTWKMRKFINKLSCLRCQLLPNETTLMIAPPPKKK